MTAKHDGKHARQALWVTQQNLARAKGGRPNYQPKMKTKKVAPPPLPREDEESAEAKTPSLAEVPPEVDPAAPKKP